MKLLNEIYAYQGKFNYEEQGNGAIPILGLRKERNLLSPLPNKRIRGFYQINHILVKVNLSNGLPTSLTNILYQQDI